MKALLLIIKQMLNLIITYLNCLPKLLILRSISCNLFLVLITYR